jgi:hypothetical protein
MRDGRRKRIKELGEICINQWRMRSKIKQPDWSTGLVDNCQNGSVDLNSVALSSYQIAEDPIVKIRRAAPKINKPVGR